jgi:hypothetical protein
LAPGMMSMAEKVYRERLGHENSRPYTRVNRIPKLYLAHPHITAAAGLPQHAILPTHSFNDGADGYCLAY